MPFLQWVNDDKARRAAKTVPFRLLKQESTFGDLVQASKNILVQGDNLDALKALLPFYRGKVKCIYIDPPYNTGSAFEHYDDNLEHSQWLSMMMPRLQLLREFLSEDGSIWVSIDDDEQAYMKILLDEVFGRQNFIASLIWQKRTSPDERTIVSDAHEYVHGYGKSTAQLAQTCYKLKLTEEQLATYKNPDNDPRGPWTSSDFTAPGYRPNQMYSIKTPTGKTLVPPSGRCWINIESVFLDQLKDNRIWFGKSGENIPRRKTFLSEKEGITPWTWLPNSEVGHSQEGKKESAKLFGGSMVFATPKPERLIHRILAITTQPGDLVLDSFLGSGTTAAVAHKMGRRYIGIEMGEHAKTHCIPRLQKVIDGEQGGISKSVNWQGGGGFTFYTLDEPVFDELGLINPKVNFETLSAFVWQRETKAPTLPAHSPLLGTDNGTAYYLLYNGILGDKRPNEGNILTFPVLKQLLQDYPHDGHKVIYAEACAGISQHELEKLQVTFKNIPYDINE